MSEGEFKKRMKITERYVKVSEIRFGQRGDEEKEPIAIMYNPLLIKSILEDAKKEFLYLIDFYEDMGYSVEGLKALVTKWFGE